MIQRVQSVFLSIVVVCMVCTFFFPVLKKTNAQGATVELSYTKMTFTAKDKTQKTTPTFYMAILAALAAVTSVFSISSFKKRLLQMKLGLLNSLLMAGILAFTMFFISQGEKFIGMNIGYKSFGIGFFLPVIALVCNILANRYIRKDERLVRESDRMR
ncbi:DUF4293 domain-containing protein [Microscilla marina]|uniref:Uncharacterized protein n=1 Tax=Microscilla marina ATCC 23134 TaxID=313606 RepID=A1ZHJ4_MICM2|nr:DUF4293 domain-containing protein [Microscilla marina]EAY30001.1 conserved hypothetical protein [Microscilla marina ATCC 23134]